MNNKDDLRKLDRRDFIATSVVAACGVGLIGNGTGSVLADVHKPVAHGMKQITPASRVTIDRQDNWYMHSAGIAAVGNELVCTYRKSDEHIATLAYIMTARSSDGGRTWKDHKEISRLGWEPDRACWVAPQLTKLRDGRLVLIVDRGEKKTPTDWPMLSQWQMPDRGMSNWLIESSDGGRTWTNARKIDDVGGEPSYILEMSNGTLMYTRTDSKPTTIKKNPSLPWGPNYYRSTAVFSDDKGKTWTRTVPLADDPLVGDCEVGIAEITPGHIIAITRIGDGGSSFGQPSRIVHSYDFGKTWTKPQLSPIYGHRAIVGQLASGKMLVTYRNAWGTSGTYLFLFDPREKLEYQPNSFIWDESRCQIKNGAMEIRTGEGTTSAVEFNLYPVEDDDSAVEIEAELAVMEADKNGCLMSAGCWVRFEPNRISFADRDAEGFTIDATKFHRYRLVNRDKKISIYVDGQLKLQTSTDGIHTRLVRFGNHTGARSPGLVATAPADRIRDDNPNRAKPLGGARYRLNSSHSLWRSVSAKVMNRRDHSIDWKWNARQGFPDQFRRDRMVVVERNASFSAGNSGYSDWTQMPDGKIVIIDYTETDAIPALDHPLLRAYMIDERDLI